MSVPGPSNPWLSYRALLAALAASALLLACGGGDDKPPAPPTPQVTTTASPPPVVVEVTGPGQLKEAALVNTISAAEIAAAVAAGKSKAPPVTPLYAVRSHRLTYVTRDGQGKEVVASGLVSVPVKASGVPSPVLSYQHGTVYKDAEAPSNKVEAAEPQLVLASLGYIVLAADYVGYGASKGTPHPYLVSAPTAAAVIDFITAARTWRQKNAVLDNGQLFLGGYSEGGYATMAAHRALQASDSTHLAQLVGSVSGAGPYHLGVTLDVLLDRVRDDNPLIGGLLSPGLLKHLGSTVRDEVRRQLIKALLPDDADVSFTTTFVDNYLADDNDAIERDSNVHDWKPALPVRMFHGRDDQTVPYAASSRTLETMRARGALTASLTDCEASPPSHLGCVRPFFAHLLGRLGSVARDL